MARSFIEPGVDRVGSAHVEAWVIARRDAARGRTGGLDFPTLLDGISHEEVYAPGVDDQAQAELLAWAGLGLRPNGHAFWIATEDYVGGCGARSAARTAYENSRAHGFSPYATNRSGGSE